MLTWEKATDLTTTTIYTGHAEIPASIKKEACKAALLMERAKEEVVMVKEEMTNTIMYYIKEHRELSCTIDSLTSPAGSTLSLYENGILTRLHMTRYQTEHHLQQPSRVFDIDDELKQQITSQSYQSYQFLDHNSEVLHDENKLSSSVREVDEMNESVDEMEELEEDTSDDDDILSQMEMINYPLSSSELASVSGVTLPVLADSSRLNPSASAVHLPRPTDASNMVIRYSCKT